MACVQHSGSQCGYSSQPKPVSPVVLLPEPEPARPIKQHEYLLTFKLAFRDPTIVNISILFYGQLYKGF